MKELNNRQINLYNYLLSKYEENEYISKKQICNDLPYEYPRHLENHNNEGNKSVAYANISKDIRVLNESDIRHIIISNHKGFKIANEEEAIRYIYGKKFSALRKLKDSNILEKKLIKDGQLTFNNNELEEINTFIRNEVK